MQEMELGKEECIIIRYGKTRNVQITTTYSTIIDLNIYIIWFERLWVICV